MTEQCGEHYEQHPTRPELVAVCTLPAGHDGEHSNLLSGKVNHPYRVESK